MVVERVTADVVGYGRNGPFNVRIRKSIFQSKNDSFSIVYGQIGFGNKCEGFHMEPLR